MPFLHGSKQGRSNLLELRVPYSMLFHSSADNALVLPVRDCAASNTPVSTFLVLIRWSPRRTDPSLDTTAAGTGERGWIHCSPCRMLLRGENTAPSALSLRLLHEGILRQALFNPLSTAVVDVTSRVRERERGGERERGRELCGR